jgi:hypothetical protein
VVLEVARLVEDESGPGNRSQPLDITLQDVVVYDTPAATDLIAIARDELNYCSGRRGCNFPCSVLV